MQIKEYLKQLPAPVSYTLKQIINTTIAIGILIIIVKNNWDAKAGIAIGDSTQTYLTFALYYILGTTALDGILYGLKHAKNKIQEKIYETDEDENEDLKISDISDDNLSEQQLEFN